jgi:hypothetical protein
MSRRRLKRPSSEYKSAAYPPYNLLFQFLNTTLYMFVTLSVKLLTVPRRKLQNKKNAQQFKHDGVLLLLF